MTIGDSVKIEAEKSNRCILGVISALQILKQNKTTIPKGITRDYPKYEVRGFMLDVGRKAFDFNTVKEFCKEHGMVQDEQLPSAPVRQPDLPGRLRYD